MIVPTRMTTFFTSIIMGLVKDNLLPCLIGGVNCGKTSILKLLPTCLTLNIERNVEHWS